MKNRLAVYDPLAQLVEHLPFKERVLGSSPRRVTGGSLRLVVRTTPFHGVDTGSSPVGNAIFSVKYGFY